MLVRSVPQYNSSNTLAWKRKPEVYSLHIDDESFSIHANHEFPILHRSGEHYRVVGSCNGIICITNDLFGINHDTYLWNPTIQKCVELPDPIYTYDKVGGFKHDLGFGFDETTNDYKVVRLVEPQLYCEPLPFEVEIYFLSSGIWKDASYLASNIGVRGFGYGRGGYGQVFLNGASHWVGYERKPPRCMVVAFHLGNEAFSCFEPPLETIPNFNLNEMNKLRPLVFQETLSVFQFNKGKACIWMMKDYGDSSSWMKHLDLDLSPNVQMVIGIRSKGELLIEIFGGLYSYDPEAMKGKQFNVLKERDLLLWKRLQEGDMEEDFNFQVPEHVSNYDPEAAPKELGISSQPMRYHVLSFHCERYTESLALLGSMNSAEMGEAKSKGKESERIHDEGYSGLAVELQHLGKEAETKMDQEM